MTHQMQRELTLRARGPRAPVPGLTPSHRHARQTALLEGMFSMDSFGYKFKSITC